MFLADEPIASSADDILCRMPFADALAEAILAQQGPQPFVIGLLGPWGSGKSSILRMMSESLGTRIARIPEHERPILINFNPWMVADEAALVTQFFEEVISALGQVNYAKGLKRAARLIETYSSIFSPLGLVPSTTGKTLGIITKTVQGLAKAVTWLLSQAESPQAQKAKINEALMGQSHKLVIVIDDIDRLTTEEVRQLFQVVKSLANFPNTIYVLSFDNVIVERQLGESITGQGAAFLDKIIQVPFFVPQVPLEEIHRVVREAILLMFRSWGKEYFDRDHFGYLFRYGIRPLIDDLRDAKRFLNVLRFNANVCKGRIAASDMIGITAIQVLEPSVFDAIRENKILFTAPTPSQTHGELGQQDAVTRLNSIVTRKQHESEEPLIEMLRLLFPKVERIVATGSGSVQYESEALNRVKGRISDPNIFDFIFKFSLPRGEYHNDEIGAILSTRGNRDGFAASLRQIATEGRLRAFLEGLTRYFAVKAVPPATARSVIEAIIDTGDEIMIETHATEDDSRPIDLHLLLVEAVKAAAAQFNEIGQRISVIKEAIANTTTSLLIPLAVNNRILNDGENEKHVIAQKIADWMADGRLVKHARVGAILNFWEGNGATRDEISSLLEAIINDESALLNFLREYVDQPQSAPKMDYYLKPGVQIDTEGLRNRLDPARLCEKLRMMIQSPSFHERRENEKTLVLSVFERISGTRVHQ